MKDGFLKVYYIRLARPTKYSTPSKTYPTLCRFLFWFNKTMSAGLRGAGIKHMDWWVIGLKINTLRQERMIKNIVTCRRQTYCKREGVWGEGDNKTQGNLETVRTLRKPLSSHFQSFWLLKRMISLTLDDKVIQGLEEPCNLFDGSCQLYSAIVRIAHSGTPLC